MLRRILQVLNTYEGQTLGIPADFLHATARGLWRRRRGGASWRMANGEWRMRTNANEREPGPLAQSAANARTNDSDTRTHTSTNNVICSSSNQNGVLPAGASLWLCRSFRQVRTSQGEKAAKVLALGCTRGGWWPLVCLACGRDGNGEGLGLA